MKLRNRISELEKIVSSKNERSKMNAEDGKAVLLMAGHIITEAVENGRLQLDVSDEERHRRMQAFKAELQMRSDEYLNSKVTLGRF